MGSSLGLAATPLVLKSAHAAEPYRLGAVQALTGTGSVSSKHSLNGIELAVEEINREGGFLARHPIQLFVRDDQTKPDIAAREAKDLILRDRVRSIIGSFSSHLTLAIEEVAYEYKVLHITASANSESLSVGNYSPYTFLVVPNSYMEPKAQAKVIAKMARDKGWKTFATFASDYEWGHSNTDAFISEVQKAYPEFKLVKQFWPKAGETEFSSYVTAIMSAKPDFVFASISGTDAYAWMRQARAYGFFEKIPYTALVALTEMMTLKDDLPRGIISVSRAPFYANMDVPMMAAMVKNYRAKFDGLYPTDFAVMHYDAVYALKQAIEKAASIDTEKVKAAMKGMTVETTRGKLRFRDIDNQMDAPSYVGIIADDPAYPFPITKDTVKFPGNETWRPESEIPALRKASGLAKRRTAADLEV
ncbi:MAG TPA: ABC transporter substrate-binding protein [Plasticicumulans sp.]|nr:ABC transporter substrate-binding protein [Plasticicumulans sp.]HNE00065.1 ABC transporter substrate-binding protein [Plasticicumulans sp.]